MPRGRHWQTGVDVSCGSHVVDYIHVCRKQRFGLGAYFNFFLGHIIFFGKC